MNFTLFFAFDCHGEKVNYEIKFPARPFITDIAKFIHRTWASKDLDSAMTDITNSCINSDSSLQLKKLKIYDEPSQLWVDLVSNEQVVEWSQLYGVPKKATTLDKEKKAIPPATKTLFVKNTPETRFPCSEHDYKTVSGLSSVHPEEALMSLCQKIEPTIDLENQVFEEFEDLRPVLDTSRNEGLYAKQWSRRLLSEYPVFSQYVCSLLKNTKCKGTAPASSLT